MSEDRPPPTVGLNTKIEADFVAPLTAVRGALEVLRDHHDLGVQERRRFVETALASCARLERSVDELATAVYAAGGEAPAAAATEGRLAFLDDDLAELDLSQMRFASTAEVNAFFDDVDAAFRAKGGRWRLLVDHTRCSVWPEAWIAFAHRSKKVNTVFAEDVARFETADPANAGGGGRRLRDDPEMAPSRAAALERLTGRRQR